MVLEHALMSVHPGQEAQFEVDLEEALRVITSAEGCTSAKVLRGVESTSTYLLLVEWTSVAAHLEGFRGSPAFTRWRELVGPWWVEVPVVEHFSPTAEQPA